MPTKKKKNKDSVIIRKEKGLPKANISNKLPKINPKVKVEQ